MRQSCRNANKPANQVRRRIVHMRNGLAIAVAALALALPAVAQHGGSHSGSAGHAGFSGHSGFAGHSGSASRGGFAGHAGFAGRPGFYGSRGISQPPLSFRVGAFATPGLQAPPASRSGFRTPYRERGFAPNRSSYRSAYSRYRPAYNDHFRGRNHDHDRDRGHGRRFVGSYGYPGWLGYSYPYPYVIDPGFYNWGDSGDSGYDQGGYAYDQGSAGPGYEEPVPYADYAPSGSGYAQAPPAFAQAPPPEYDQAPPATAAPRQPYAGSAAAVPASAERELTVIFKDGRAPEKMQNYMMNSKSLTDLDHQHYEQIPLDQIDIAATEHANRAIGLDFQVPGPSRE